MAQLVIECTNVPIMLNVVTDWGGALFFLARSAKNVGHATAGGYSDTHIHMYTYAHVLVHANTYSMKYVHVHT